jgi:hypothetical protein
MKRPGAIIAIIAAVIAPISASAGTAQKVGDAVFAVEEAYGRGETAQALGRAVSEAIESGVPAEEIEVFIREASRADRSPEEVSAFIDAATALNYQGISPGLLFCAGLEGFARGVSEPEMKLAIDTLQSRLLFCRRIARRHTGRKKAAGAGSLDDLLIGALYYTMSMGFEEDQVSALSTAAEKARLGERMFFNVLRVAMELISLDLDPGRVSTLMARAVSSGAGAEEVAGFPAFVQAERENGFTDDAIYEELLGKIDEAAAGGKQPSGDGNGIGTPGAGSIGRGGASGGRTPAGGSPGGRK